MSATNLALDWHEPTWAAWQRICSRSRQPHALLISGPDGVGKWQFAQRLAQHRLCDNPTKGGACGLCSSCHTLAAGSHPDYLTIEPEEGKSDIGVDQIRRFSASIRLSAHQSNGARVSIISPADRLNVNAANGLLKLLEEPPENRQFILISSRPGLLPATIRSRCQTLRVPLVSKQASVAWLSSMDLPVQGAQLAAWITGDAPLAAATLCSDSERLQRLEKRLDELAELASLKVDPISLAQATAKDPVAEILSLHYRVATDMLAHRLSMQVSPPPIHPALDDLRVRAEQLNLDKLFKFTGRLSEWLTLQRSQVNSQFLFETVFNDWLELFRKNR